MFSKNNSKLPKNEREYFDKPVVYQKEGCQFNPLYKKPFEYGIEGNRKMSRLNIRDRQDSVRNQMSMTNTSNSPLKIRSGNSNEQSFRSPSPIGGNQILHSTFTHFGKTPLKVPVTNGLNNTQLF